jgi:hypothetical protein
METSALDKLLKRLDESGPPGLAARQYLDNHKVQVRLKSQSTGARWTVLGGIELNPSQLANEPYALSLIVHEVCHMRQGFYKALSVQGELAAWQEQFACLHSMSGRYSVDDGRNGLIAELMSLSGENRSDLLRARELMRKFAGEKYHIDWLPIFPLLREIRFRLTGH